MPRAWSEEEKNLVRESLVSEGRRLFETYGLQKTTIDEIARAAHVSKGAFYLFFGSKEELYFEVLHLAEQEFRDKAYAHLVHPVAPRRESFRHFLEEVVDLLTNEPLYRHIGSYELHYLMRKLPRQVLEGHLQSDRDYLEQSLKTWIANGWMREVDADALTGILLAFVYATIHRDNLTEAAFDKSTRLLIDMMTAYLVPEE